MTQTIVIYLALAVAPAAAFALARRAAERWVRPRHRRPAPTADASTTDNPDLPPGARVLQPFGPRLRRLGEEYARLQTAPGPGTHLRLRSVVLAYDDTLLDCCRALGVPAPGRAPLPAATRLQTEALLVRHGLTW